MAATTGQKIVGRLVAQPVRPATAITMPAVRNNHPIEKMDTIPNATTATVVTQYHTPLRRIIVSHTRLLSPPSCQPAEDEGRRARLQRRQRRSKHGPVPPPPTRGSPAAEHAVLRPPQAGRMAATRVGCGRR